MTDFSTLSSPVTQAKLNEIWNLLSENATVWRWAAWYRGDFQILVQDKHTLWYRVAPNGVPEGRWIGKRRWPHEN